ncbi:MAG: hypothetical protein JOY81_02165 [Alphaproteobacteria bacterium]|nr:hypothetical protein [Alphaproteobacteria bacterium]
MLKELVVPVVGGVAGGAAFFCLFVVLGRFLRAPTPESRPAPRDTGSDVTSIKRGIEELKEQGALPQASAEKPEDGQKMLFRNLYRSAARRAPVEALAPRQLLELKMPYQAVLNAAVNFEREIRRRADLPNSQTISLPQLFQQPQFNLSPEKVRELETLRRVRNGIVQGAEAFVDPVEAEELVMAYERAVSWFERRDGVDARAA